MRTIPKQKTLNRDTASMRCLDFFVPKSLVPKKPPADVHRGEWKLPLTAAAPGTRVGGILLLDLRFLREEKN